MLTAITGINWGDEGKGRMVDLLCRDYDIVARYQGGDNAGHTVKNECGKFVLNLVPSGILHPSIVCVMGGGMVIDPEHLEKEIADLREQGVKITPDNLKISDRATITMPFHVEQDGLEEARLAKTGAQFGSTKRGIAYTYGDKYMKKTLRMGDLVHMDAGVRKRLETLVESKNLTMVNIYNQKPVNVDDMWNWCKHFQEVFGAYICDVGQYLADADDAGKKIMFEAQLGALRDIDYGIYPYTTSSNTIGAYAPIGAGIPGRKLNKSIGIMKAYSSCVGDGPFTTELAMTEEEKHLLREAGHEYGAATGRPRRVGPPVVAQYKLADGTVTDRFPTGKTLDDAQPVVVKLPGWHCDITSVRKYEDLPEAARGYVEYLEKAVGCKIKYISVGPECKLSVCGFCRIQRPSRKLQFRISISVGEGKSNS